MSSGVGFNSNAKYKSPREPVSNIYFYPYWLYHKLNGLKHVERFPFSATFLVMFTDFGISLVFLEMLHQLLYYGTTLVGTGLPYILLL